MLSKIKKVLTPEELSAYNSGVCEPAEYLFPVAKPLARCVARLAVALVDAREVFRGMTAPRGNETATEYALRVNLEANKALAEIGRQR